MIRNFQGCFVFIPKLSGDAFFSNIPNISVVIKCEEHNFQKSQVTNQKNSEYLRRLKPLSGSFQPFSNFRNFQAIFAPSNSYFTEKSHWVPLTSSQLACQLSQLEHGTSIKGQGSNLSKPKFFQVFFSQLHFVSLTAINLQFSWQDHFQASPTEQEGVEGCQCLFEVQVQLTQPLLPDVLLPVNKTV